MAHRMRGVVSMVMVVVAALVLVVVAVRAEGRPASRGETNDGGAWLLDRRAGAVGHVNRSSREVSGAVRVATPGTVYDTDQAAGIVLVHDRSQQQLTLVDDRVYAPTISVPLGAVVDVHAVDDGVTVVRTNPLTVWSSDTATLASTVEDGIDDLPAVVSSSESGMGVVTIDQRVVAADGGGVVTWWDGGEDATSSSGLGVPSGLTAVGDVAVVSEEGDVAVVRPEQPAMLWTVDDVAVWQQPGPDADRVIGVASDGVVQSFDLEDGRSQIMVELPGSDPVAPIFHGGCTFALAQQPAVFARACGDQQDIIELSGHGGGELQLRLVNGWVWINAVEDGTSWVIGTDGDLEQADDVGDALQDQEGDGEEGEAVGDSTQQVNDNEADTVGSADDLTDLEINEPPVANPDEQTGRSDQPMVVDVLANDTDPNGDVLLVSSIATTSQDAVVVVTGDQRFVQVSPGPGFTGNVSFDYTVTDGRGGEATTTARAEFIPGSAANRAPVAETDFAATAPGRAVSLNLLDNDTDPDGDAISLTGVAGEGVARPAWQPDGDITVIPDLTASGELSLTYTIVDSLGEVAEGRLRVQIRDVEEDNQPPDARHDWGVTTVGAPITFNVLDNDRDPEGQGLVVASATPTVVQVPEGGDTARVSISPDGAFLVEPPVAGSYVYSYVVSDGSFTDTALVRVEVSESETNRPPVAVRDTAVIPRGSSRVVSVLRNDADPDGDVIGMVDWTSGTNLVVEPVPGIGFRVTVSGDADGEENFRYSISDGVNEPVETAVYVLVSDEGGQDQLPVALPDQAEARPGQPLTIPVLRNDHDPEGGVLRVVHVPERDDVDLTIGSAGQNVILTLPDDATSGVTFPYEVEDEAGNRASATVEVLAVPPDQDNRTPVAVPDVTTTAADEPVVVDVLANDHDPDGDPIIVESVASQPANGAVELLDDGTVDYTPADGFSGTDLFRYWLVDAGGLRVEGDVLVGVMPAAAENRPPYAVPDEFTLTAGDSTTALDVLANDSDPDGDELTVVDVTDVGQGSLEVATAGVGLAYTPPATISGDSVSVGFRYTIDDGAGHAVDTTVTVEVRAEAEPQPPVAVDDVVGPVEGNQSVAVDVLANDLDPDGDPTDLAISTSEDDVSIVGATVRIPVTEVTRTIVYTVTDADGLAASASITVSVQPNRAPVVEPFETDVEHDTATRIDLTGQASDPDDDELSFLYNRDVRGGSVAVESADASTLVVAFTPDPGHTGAAGFSYSVQDGNEHEVAGSVVLTVLPPDNLPPVVGDHSMEAEVGRNTTLALDSLVEDPDEGDTHTFEASGPDGPLRMSRSGQRLTLTPELSATGQTATFTVTATDATGEAATGTVTVTMTPSALPPPTANDDTARTTQGKLVTVDVLSNDVGSGVALVSADGGRNGRATISGDQVVFTPDADFFGDATASYVIEDEQQTTRRRDTASIRVEVIGLPDAPQSPQVTEASKEATLTWTAPARNGAPITSYRVEHDQGGTREATATSLTWNGLTNGTQYRFRVRAFNEAGWGEWSPWSPHVTPDERPGRPAAPTVQWANGKLDVAWQTPVNQGTPVTEYDLQIGGAAAETRNLVAQRNPTYPWEGLANGSNYQFRVRAKNAKDWSPWSPWSSTEHPNTTPGAPGAPGVSNGPNYLDVQWSPPYDGGDTITRYEIRLEGSGTTQVKTVSGAATSNFRWAGLENGKLFTFQVRAVNRATPVAAGWSAKSAPEKACDVPAAPPVPTAVRGDQQVTLDWQAPGNGGCDITNYQILNASGSLVKTVTAASRSTTITGLTNGTEYSFRVRALNTEFDDQGAGASSPASAAVVPAGKPFAPPSFASSVTGEGQLTVSWGAANGNGAPVQHYIVTVNGNPQSPTSNRSMSFNALTGGTTYSFTVRAVNNVGQGATSSTSGRAETRPDKVGTPSVSNSTRGQLKWTWTAPNSRGNGINHYEIDRSTGGNLTTSNRSYTWTGLRDSTTRSIRVRACNDWGCGTWSSSRSGTTKPPPPPPPSLTVTGSVDDPDRGGTERNPIVDMRNFDPNRTYDFKCDNEGPFNTDKDNRFLTTDSNGNFTGIHSRCFASDRTSVTMKIVPNGGGSTIASATYANP